MNKEEQFNQSKLIMLTEANPEWIKPGLLIGFNYANSPLEKITAVYPLINKSGDVIKFELTDNLTDYTHVSSCIITDPPLYVELSNNPKKSFAQGLADFFHQVQNPPKYLKPGDKVFFVNHYQEIHEDEIGHEREGQFYLNNICRYWSKEAVFPTKEDAEKFKDNVLELRMAEKLKVNNS